MGKRHLVLGAFALWIAGCLAAQSPAPNLPDSQKVIAFLNQTIAWYSRSAGDAQLASELSDLPYAEDNRQFANQIIRFAFDFARADADIADRLSKDGGTAPGPDASALSNYQSLLDRAAKAESRVKASQAEIDGLRQKLEKATSRQQQELRSALAETQSELELAQTRREVFRTMVALLNSSTSGGGFRAQIEDLAKTIPAAGPTETDGAQKISSSASSSLPSLSRKPEPSGIFGLATDLFALSRKARALEEAIQMTNALADASKNLRTPLVAELREITRRGDQLTDQPDSTDPALLAQQKREVDSLTGQFKLRSAVALPLMKQRIVLDQYARSTTNWRNAIRSRYAAEWRSLAIRLAVLAVFVGLLLAASQIWKRAIFRYARDHRRRHQYLLVHRITFWFLLIMILAFAFVSELGSVATFAGLLTAGLALALQNVIVSIAGYFILIGQYGLRVGDRVRIGGITGEVIEIGLVRVHVMELSGTGAGLQPTGRVVALSNSLVFQPRGGIFKQIPGTNFVWRQISLTLAPDSDYRAVEERILGAVEKVYSEHREAMEAQSLKLNKTISSVEVPTLAPQSRLRLTPRGLEVVVRYPLEYKSAARIDDQITREVLDAVDREPKLKRVKVEMPMQTVEDDARGSR